MTSSISVCDQSLSCSRADPIGWKVALGRCVLSLVEGSENVLLVNLDAECRDVEKGRLRVAARALVVVVVGGSPHEDDRLRPAQASGAGLPSLDPRQLPELVAVWQTCGQKCGRTTLLATSSPFCHKFPFCHQFGMPLPIRQNTWDIKQFDDLAADPADGRPPSFPPK